MKKKTIITIIITAIISCAFSINVFAYMGGHSLSELLDSVACKKSVVKINNLDSDISEYQVDDIDDQIETYEDQIELLEQNNNGYTPAQIEAQKKIYQKQIITLQYQRDNLISQNGLTQQKTDQQIHLTKHKLKAEYYNACLYTAQLNTENANLLYLNKSLEVEKEKLALNETTENAVAIIENSVELSENKIESLTNSIDASKKAMLVILEEYSLSTSSFNPDFDLSNASLPTHISSFSNIQDNFISNNLDIEKLNYTIENTKQEIDRLSSTFGSGDNTYKVAAAELEKSKLQLETTSESYKSYVLTRYYAYTSANTNYATMLNQKKILDKFLEILNQNYSVGQISELQYLSEKAKLASQSYDITAAFVQAANLYDEVILLNDGIIIE